MIVRLVFVQNVKKKFMTKIQHKAHVSQEALYKLWRRWGNSSDAYQRQLALKAKCFAAVYWSRIMDREAHSENSN